MIIFTYKLEKYIKTKILPRILLDPNKYTIKGSFRRRIPYVTDIDIVNEVYPEINSENIYEHVNKLVKSLYADNNNDIILVYVTCGADDRFKIDTGSDEELNGIRSLLFPDERIEFDAIMEKYSKDFDRKIFFINEMIWPLYKLRWTAKNILDNNKNLRHDLSVKFTDIVKKNQSLLLQYYVRLGSYPIGFDVVVNYEPKDMTDAYQMASLYQLKLANYGNEYYFMIFPFKYYFKSNTELRKEIEDLVEKKFGLYKQLMVRIDTYHTLYKTGNLNIKLATGIVSSIVADAKKLPGFNSNVLNRITQIAMNNPPNVKMKEWSYLLDLLYDEINTTVNSLSKDYFFKYLAMLPKNLQEQYYLVDNISQKRIKAPKSRKN